MKCSSVFVIKKSKKIINFSAKSSMMERIRCSIHSTLLSEGRSHLPLTKSVQNALRMGSTSEHIFVFYSLWWINPPHRMKIAYSRRNPYDSSNDCGLCSTMVEFNELNTTYPIEVMIKAKNEGSVRKYLVDVNGNAGPACELIATALYRCLSSTVF